MALHIAKSYPAGVGHIEAWGGAFLVSFYRGAGRVWQAEAATLEIARRAVHRFALEAEGARYVCDGCRRLFRMEELTAYTFPEGDEAGPHFACRRCEADAERAGGERVPVSVAGVTFPVPPRPTFPCRGAR